MRRGEVHEVAVIGPKTAVSGGTNDSGFFKNRLEHRREIAGRGIDDLQYLSGRSLADETLVEPLTQLRVGTPKFNDLVVERHGHVLLPALSRSYDTSVSFRLHPRSMLLSLRRDDAI